MQGLHSKAAYQQQAEAAQMAEWQRRAAGGHPTGAELLCDRTTVLQRLGEGGEGHVDLVRVRRTDGSELQCARKVRCFADMSCRGVCPCSGATACSTQHPFHARRVQDCFTRLQHTERKVLGASSCCTNRVRLCPFLVGTVSRTTRAVQTMLDLTEDMVHVSCDRCASLLDINVPGVLPCAAIEIAPHAITDLASGAEHGAEAAHTLFRAQQGFVIKTWARHYYMAMLPGGARPSWLPLHARPAELELHRHGRARPCAAASDVRTLPSAAHMLHDTLCAARRSADAWGAAAQRTQRHGASPSAPRSRATRASPPPMCTADWSGWTASSRRPRPWRPAATYTWT